MRLFKYIKAICSLVFPILFRSHVFISLNIYIYSKKLSAYLEHLNHIKNLKLIIVTDKFCGSLLFDNSDSFFIIRELFPFAASLAFPID